MPTPSERIKALEAKVEKLEKKNGELSTAAESHKGELKEAEDNLSKVASEKETAEKAAAELKEKNTALAADLVKVQGELDESKKAQESFDKKVAEKVAALTGSQEGQDIDPDDDGSDDDAGDIKGKSFADRATYVAAIKDPRERAKAARELEVI